MDKKELLKRWALAYTEPSLFYVPWREAIKDILVFITNVYRGDTFYYYDHTEIGAVFTTDGRFVTKYVFTSQYFGKYFKKGNYVYKEAVSPRGHLLSDYTNFSVSGRETNSILVPVNHHTAQSFYTADYIKHENINTTTVLEDGYTTIYNSYEIVVRHYALKDNQIYRDMVIDNTQPIIREITHNENKDEGFIYYTRMNDYMTKREREYINKNGYKTNYVELNFKHFMVEPTSQTSWTISSVYPYDSAQNKMYGDCLLVNASTENLIEYSDDDPYAQWIRNVTKEDLFNLYDFIKSSHMIGKHFESNPRGLWAGLEYYVYIDNNGGYHTDDDESTEFGVYAYIYSYQSLGMRLPHSLLYRESQNIPDNILNDYNLILTDHIEDTRKYFSQISDSYTPKLYGRTGQYLGLDPIQINQELLDLINNESGGET